MSGWQWGGGGAGLFMDTVKESSCFGGARVQREQRVITLHPVALVRFTKADTGGQACQSSRGQGGRNKRG